MGFYPVAPVTGQYVIGSPLFESIKLELANNKSVNINVSNNEKENVYVSSVKVNNQNYNKNWLDHSIFVTGGEIDFSMSSIPNYFWGSNKESVPYSMSSEEK
jgi:putative alpha-1,2-mannosidase